MKKLILAALMVIGVFSASFRENTLEYNYMLDPEASSIEWNGATPKVSHQGSFSVISEGIEVKNGHVTGGTFTIPIASIRNFDLPKAVKPILLKHLKSEDFFNIKVFPEASFAITKVTRLVEFKEGAIDGANTIVTGDFTMLGNTHTISFPAIITIEGNTLKAEAFFKIDRSQWGMTYGTDPERKKHYIYPEVDIHLKISASQQPM